MNRQFLLIIITLSLLAGSCAGRKTRVIHRNKIPEKELISILTEIHLADGLLILPEINRLFSDRDTISAYLEIVEKHGYTKKAMDRTMRYYFIKRPKKLIKIYDKVLGALSEMDSRIEKEMPVFRAGNPNFWQGNAAYYLPDPTGRDTTWFDFPANILGKYTIRFTLTIYPDDQTVDPRPGIFFCYSDSVPEGKRNYLSDFPYLKDGWPHEYSFSIEMKKQASIRIMGWFIDQENQAPFRVKHLRIDNIVLSRMPNQK